MRILIVDDAQVATVLSKWLADRGWGAPGVATSSDAAVEWINRNGGLDVLVCEVAIEPADGFGLHEAIESHLPDMRTVFMSTTDRSAEALARSHSTFLKKPVSGETLDATIRRLYEAPRVSVARRTGRQSSRHVSPVAAQPAASALEPVATAVAKATAQPVAASTPRAVTPHAVAVVATPVVTTPKAVAKPVAATAKPTAIEKVGGEVELPPDALVGRTIGDYKIEAKIGEATQGGIYRALQTTISRLTRFYVLAPDRAADPAELAKFAANAGFRARVSHPFIFAVYEAGHADGVHYYSCEYVPCRSLRQIAQGGDHLDELTALHTIKVTAESMDWLEHQKISHTPLSSNTLLVDDHSRPRVANIATQQGSQENDAATDMRSLGAAIVSVLPADQSPLGVLDLASDIAENGNLNHPTWQLLQAAAASLEPRLAPQDAHKIEARERHAAVLVQQTKERQRRRMMTNLIVMATILALVIVFLGFMAWLRFKGSAAKSFDRMVEVPSGEFLYQDGQKVTLPAFHIDEYEVTIGQYAKFLEYLAAHPAEAAKFDHPDQPKGKSHVPTGWADQDLSPVMYGYYERAKRWGKFHDAKLDLDSPVFGVDWFDAFAYANWKGRRLPTEQEWEKAGRGTKGSLYPWGNDPEVSRVNSGVDMNPDPKQGGEKDGFDRWAPVEGVRKDKSSFGAIGMAGNVSEWTASQDVDPKIASAKVHVIRGGNYRTPDYVLTRRVLKLSDYESDEALGFRTASDTAPPPPKEP